MPQAEWHVPCWAEFRLQVQEQEPVVIWWVKVILTILEGLTFLTLWQFHCILFTNLTHPIVMCAGKEYVLFPSDFIIHALQEAISVDVWDGLLFNSNYWNCRWNVLGNSVLGYCFVPRTSKLSKLSGGIKVSVSLSLGQCPQGYTVVLYLHLHFCI